MDFQTAIIDGVNTLRVGTIDIGTLYTYEYENGSPKSFRDKSGKVFARTYQSMKKKLGIQDECRTLASFHKRSTFTLVTPRYNKADPHLDRLCRIQSIDLNPFN